MKLVLLLILALLATSNAAAQTIRGVVVEEGSRVPLRGAFVALQDSSGVTRSATLTDSAGRFYLRVAGKGAFSVAAELIGHESGRIAVPADASARTLTIALPIAAVKLEALNVSGGRRCTGRPERMQETAQVWDEVRKALTIASWTEKENRAHFEVRNFERVLHPRTGMLLRETVKTATSTNRPYAAVSADTLVAHGFVRTFTADSVMFFGPDADVLLSDVFLDTHCFWLRRAKEGTSTLIGLAFEPISGRQLSDITGTLWVDARSSELKFIEFRYTNLSRDLDLPGVGGRTDFRRMPTGAWIVDRWFIRLPAGQSTVRGFVVAALVEGGGEIVNARLVGSENDAVRKTRIAGVVYDSISGNPLADAMVYLSGTAHRTATDSAGHFVINNVSEGHYVAAFWHASFDSLPALPEPYTVTVLAASPVELSLAIPRVATLIERACDAATDGGVLTGYVRDADGSALPAEKVTVTYSERGRITERHGDTDRTGRFALCGLPLNTDLTLKSGQGKAVTTRIGAARFARKDMSGFGTATGKDD